MNLVEVLNKLGEEANKKFPSLNWGGCCVFAGLVAEILDRKGYPVQGRAASNMASKRDASSITEARKKVKRNTVAEWNTHGISFGHVGIEVYDGTDIYLYDSNGCVNPEEHLDGMPSFEGRLTVLELNELWQYNGPTLEYSISWNSCFDRGNIPYLHSLIKQHLIRLPEVA